MQKVANFRHLLFPLLILSLSGCVSRPKVESASEALTESSRRIPWKDDLGFEHFQSGLKKHIEYFSSKKLGTTMQFGPYSTTLGEYLGELKILEQKLVSDPGGQSFIETLDREWQLMEVYGREKPAEVLVTSYYDPEVWGSTVPSPKLSEPLYRLPDDMFIIDFDQFLGVQPNLKLSSDIPFEQKTRFRILRGRMSEKSQIIPYFSRKQIVSEQALKGRGLEIAWVDPVDAFFLQIQGSGMIRLTDGTHFRVGYAGQNGHPYEAIGRHLLDVIPREEMSMQRIRQHLNTLSDEEKNRIMNINASYVFFQKLESDALTYSGIEVISGRSIATDYNLFPKGALAFLNFEVPIFDGEDVIRFEPSSRFVLDHDTGGAIRGPGRLDLYWGSGDEAAKHAGVMKQPGELFYLIPKSIMKPGTQ